MPPRYAYWTIIAGGLPTAFRSATLEDLLPTFQRIRERHPDAIMKWFARGKLWDSPEDARVRRDEPRGRRPPNDPAGNERDARPREKRGRDWRPGGEHRDPRQKFMDAKKAQNAARRQERWQKKGGPVHRAAPVPGTPPHRPSPPPRGPSSPPRGPSSSPRGPSSLARRPSPPPRGPSSPPRGSSSSPRGASSSPRGPSSPPRRPNSPPRGPSSPPRGPFSPPRRPFARAPRPPKGPRR